jgi:uncharacterized protein YyaL (SSP411 family)
MTEPGNMTDRNRLGEETSPYLLQHKANPVHWQPWSPDTLAAAKAENKPILLFDRLCRLPLVPRDGP